MSAEDYIDFDDFWEDSRDGDNYRAPRVSREDAARGRKAYQERHTADKRLELKGVTFGTATGRFTSDHFPAVFKQPELSVSQEHKNRLRAYQLSMQGFAVIRNAGCVDICRRLKPDWHITSRNVDKRQCSVRRQKGHEEVLVSPCVTQYMYNNEGFIDPREEIWPGKSRGWVLTKRTNPQEILDAAPSAAKIMEEQRQLEKHARYMEMYGSSKESIQKWFQADFSDLERRILAQAPNIKDLVGLQVTARVQGRRPDLTIIDDIVVDCTQAPSQMTYMRELKPHQEKWFDQWGFNYSVAMGWRHKLAPRIVRSKEVEGLYKRIDEDGSHTIQEHYEMASNRIKAITIGRTVSKDYQSKKFELTLEVDNDLDLNKIRELGIAMVDVTLGVKRIARDERVALNKFARDYFDDRDFDISDLNVV